MLLSCLASLLISGTWVICPEVTVTRDILNEGFHRDLVTRVTLVGLSRPLDGCKVMLKEMLPTGLYLDPYQLASLQEHNVTETLLSDLVDVEAPEYLSAGHTAFIFVKLDPTACAECFRADVPVHVRYHQPSGEGGKALIILQNPQLLIRCSTGIALGECWEHSEVEAPCVAIGESVCRWKDVKYRPVPEELSIQVPVGISQHSPAICALTFFVTLFCSGLLLASVYRHGRLYI